MEPYVGIVVFELSRVGTQKSYYREDVYIVYADTEKAALKRVKSLAYSQECEGDAENGSVKVRHIVDVAPALYGAADKDIDLYSRHFASLEDYERFEVKLGGPDPLKD